MFVFGGYAVDKVQPNGPEGLLTSQAVLMRPAHTRWLPLKPTGMPPTPRAMHGAVLLCGDGESDGAGFGRPRGSRGRNAERHAVRFT